MNGLQIAIIGAGSTYTPELIDGFIKRRSELPVERFILMDIDAERLQVSADFTRRMLDFSGMKSVVDTTDSYEKAVKGSDFVLGQIRVGQLPARVLDERIPLSHGLIGQETTGIGGFMKALRTIPVMRTIAETIEKHSPHAWFINFSNPSGIIAEYLLNNTNVHMMGLCNVPITMKQAVLDSAAIVDAVTGKDRNVRMEYLGLNHLSWITAVEVNGKDVLPELMKNGSSLVTLNNISGIELSAELLDAVRGIPSPYLQYFYHRNEKLAHLQEEAKSRGEVCIDIENDLLKLYRDTSVREKPEILDQRGGHLYSDAAVALISAIANDKQETHTVDVKNDGALPFMEKDDVVEVDCSISASGAVPHTISDFSNRHVIDLMRTVKAYERHTVKAGMTGDYSAAMNALMINPLVGDFDVAKACFDELLEAHKVYLPQFFQAGSK